MTFAAEVDGSEVIGLEATVLSCVERGSAKLAPEEGYAIPTEPGLENDDDEPRKSENAVGGKGFDPAPATVAVAVVVDGNVYLLPPNLLNSLDEC